MQKTKVNKRPLLEEKHDEQKRDISMFSRSLFKKYFNLNVSQSTIQRLIARIIIAAVTIFCIVKFIKYNNSFEINLMNIKEDTLDLFNSLGFPKNSKDLVYSSLEKWGFHLSDIAEEGLNSQYKIGDDISQFKYSKDTYKNILFSFYDKKGNSEIEKNHLLYEYLELLETKKIETFYDFLDTFVALQDLACLPLNYKGIYANGKLFLSKLSKGVVASDEYVHKTLLNQAPFLYLTSHGGRKKNVIRNICKFSRDGYFMGSVLLPFEQDNVFFNMFSLRGLLLYDNYILVVDSFKHNSKIFKFSDPVEPLGMRREFISCFISQDEKTNPMMIHPYGIKNHKDYFYVSSQNTSSLLRFHISDGMIGPSVEAMKQYNVPGLVVKFPKNEEIRGIDFDSFGRCYVANKQVGIQVYDEDFNLLKTIPAYFPISVIYIPSSKHIVVGSSKSHDIKEYDVHNFELIKTIKHPLLKHVAGISVYDDSIFVVSQKKNKVLEFSLSTSLLKNTIVDDLSDIGERVIAVPA